MHIQIYPKINAEKGTENNEQSTTNGSFTFVQNRNALFITFFLRPKVDDFRWWKGMPGGVVYGRMMDLCCLYGPETTDSMDIEVKRG